MRRVIAVSVVLLLLAGCSGHSGKGGVAGKITYKDQPVNNATLNFYPAKGGEPLFVPVGPDGTFRTSDLPAGDYKVTVEGSAPSGMPNLKNVPPDKQAEAKEKLEKMQQAGTIAFPPRYTQKQTSPLTCTVGKSETKVDWVLTDS